MFTKDYVHFYTQHGKFNLLSNELQWSLYLYAVVDGVQYATSEIFDDDPLCDIERPSEVVACLYKRFKDRYISNESRKQQYEMLVEKSKVLDYMWVTKRIEELQETLKELNLEKVSLEEDFDDGHAECVV